MKKSYRLLLFILAVGGIFLSLSGKAYAETVVTGVSGSPAVTNPRPTCVNGEPVDFAATVGNIRFNETTGVITYDIGLGWRSCTGGVDTRAYAIYGPPEICPVSGTYGASGTVTDCVKYIGNPVYQGDGNGLQCGALRDAACLTGDGWSVIRAEQGPGGGLETIPNMTYQIPNWSFVKNFNDSHSFSRQMCQFYKNGFRFQNQVPNSRCLDISLRIDWEFRAAPDNGECEVSIRGGSVVAPGETRIVDYTVRNTGGSNWGLENGNDRHRLRNRDTSIWGQPQEIEIEGSGVSNSGFGRLVLAGGATSWGRNLQVPAGTEEGTYTFNWQIYGKGNAAPSAQYIGAPCPLTITVERPTDKPFFRVYGGDVIAGRQFSSGGVCGNSTKNNQAKIRAYSKPRGGGTNAGSGGQFAVSAASTIERFMSMNMRSNNPIDLSFGNYGASGPLNLTTAGNDVAGYTGCIGNLYELATGPLASTGEFGTISSGQVAGQTFTNATNKDQMQFVSNGDVTITGDITYDNASWGSFEEIKVPMYIVNGDINIRHDVQRLDGLYFATGQVNTCLGTTTQCKASKLTINGAVISSKIELRRLLGDVDTASPNVGPGAADIAEVINFTPEIYLALSSIVPTDNLVLNGNYDSVVGLPPVL